MFERPHNRGKTPLYCCRSHRQRAYEARKAARVAEQFVEIQDVVEFRDQLNKLERSGVVSSSFASLGRTVADSFTAGPALGGISKMVADSLRFATSPALEGIGKTVADSFKAFGPAMSLAPNPPLDELQLFMAESSADSLLARESLLRAGIPSATLDANAELDFEDLNDALLEVELERLIKEETGRFEEARASEDDLRVAGAGLCILILLASVHGTDLSSNLEDIVYDGFRQMWFLLHATGLAEQSTHVSGFMFWWCIIGGAAKLIERRAESTRP